MFCLSDIWIFELYLFFGLSCSLFTWFLWRIIWNWLLNRKSLKDTSLSTRNRLRKFLRYCFVSKYKHLQDYMGSLIDKKPTGIPHPSLHWLVIPLIIYEDINSFSIINHGWMNDWMNGWMNRCPYTYVGSVSGNICNLDASKQQGTQVVKILCRR